MGKILFKKAINTGRKEKIKQRIAIKTRLTLKQKI